MAANNALGLRVLTDLSKQLKTTDKVFASAVRSNLRKGIKQQGADVLGAVKAAAAWSTRIPGATALSIRYNVKGASVRIQVNHNKAPHARGLELGNRAGFNEVEIATRIAAGAKNRRAAIAQGKKSGTGIVSSRLLRHPVYHKSSEPGGWAVQPTRPFFFPTLAKRRPGIDQAMERVAVQAAHDAGFR